MASTDQSASALVPPPPPEISAADAARFAREHFGLVVEAEALGSNQDRNFLLTAIDGPRRLLKIANPGTSAAELEAQSAATRLVSAAAPGVRVPLALDPVTGAAAEAGATTVRAVEHEGRSAPVRVLDYLDGRTLSGSGHLAPRVVRALGTLAARVDLALAGLDHPGTVRESQWDLRRAPEVLVVLLPHVTDPTLRGRLQSAATEAWAALSSVADTLPEQVIHGDLTDDNVVSLDPVGRLPDGVIDFGDLNHSWAVGELAVTVSSLLHHDGVDVARALAAVEAYHRARPLSRAEAGALWPLVVVRAAVLVASGHHVVATDPGNRYAEENLVHEQAIFDEATSVPLPVATARVVATVGQAVDEVALPAHGPLLEGLDPEAFAVLDLSASSSALDHGRWLEPGVEDRLADEALSGGARAVVSRFAEPRLTGATPAATEAPANTALAVDVTVAQPHRVLAPWPGSVRRTPTGLLLRHDEVDLHLDGVDAEVPDGGSVAAGAPLGGSHARLRVRVTRAGTDAPGAVRADWARAWRALVADPTPLLLGRSLPDPRQDPEALAARRRRVLADVQEHYYDEPPMIVRGWRQYLVDSDARVYLDSVNNVTSIGHAHPRLTEAVAAQWRTLNTNSRFHYPAITEYAERIVETLPDGLDAVFLVNSGSEAVDLALRIARACTDRADVLAVREAYHGWTFLSDAVSTSVADNPQALETRPDWVHTLDAPNSYRGRHRGPDAHRYAEEAVAEIERLARAGTPVGAFIAEAFYGNAGGIALPDGYLPAVYAAVRAHGGLAVADEVQVGYGRLGSWFWGFEQQGAVPDVVAVAKAIGNGQPLGAVITSHELADRYRSQGYFFSSAGGSPVSCVAGLAVLDVIRDEGLQENARQVGDHFRRRLERLAERHPLIGAVHGSGLYLGAELVRDPSTLEPAAEETAAICERMRDLGVIIQPTSDRLCVLKIKPPLCVTTEDVDAFVDALDVVLRTGW
jgi:4-aminobutyrate aminotransferase-like enzyme/Ser/Thr protein kinase RdoA (MazF antagonist)